MVFPQQSHIVWTHYQNMEMVVKSNRTYLIEKNEATVIFRIKLIAFHSMQNIYAKFNRLLL